MRKSILYKATITILLIGIILTAVFWIYVKSAVDFSFDESLFISNKNVYPTRFYYDSSPGGEYTPIEFYSIYNGDKRSWIRYEEINTYVKDGFIATEDRDFFSHHGVNLKRTALAALNSLFHFKSRFGASTITQQLIKNISGDNDNSINRKIKEIIRAVNIENNHGKEEIFELYMNIAPMGNGICGVGLAADYYFGKSMDELTLSECAIIVGITNAPSRYNPYSNINECKKRRDVVLYSMLECGYISGEQYEGALNEEISLNSSGYGFDSIYPWFVETVCDELCADLVKYKNMSESAARHLILNGGIDVYTTMDYEIQTTLERYFENDGNFEDDELKYAMTVYEASTGELKGIIGNKGTKSANRIINNATVPHTPGSCLKPLALYAPLIDTRRYNWASIFDDTPVSFIEGKEGIYEYPKNYPRVYDGRIALCDALCASKNTVAVRIFNILKQEQIFKLLKNDFGFDTLVEKMTLNNGSVISDIALAPLALGQLSVGVNLRRLSEAYCVFTNDGVLNSGKSYVCVYRSDGDIIFQKETQSKRIFSKETAQIMSMMLSEVVERGTAKSVTLKEIVDTAGKTGTSGGDKDRLFVGFTPYYTAGIWCGYDDNVHAVGNRAKSHLDIWDDVMTEIHLKAMSRDDNLHSFRRDKIERLPFCKDSGKLFSENCMYDLRGDRMEYGYFSKECRPSTLCDTHRIYYMDIKDGSIYEKSGRLKNFIKISLLDIPIREYPIDIEVGDEGYSYKNYDIKQTPDRGRRRRSK